MNAKKVQIRKGINLANAFFYLLVLLIAFGLKYHYSKAGSDALVWILAPTAALVEQISGIPFEYETRTGFVNSFYRVIIAPSCTGVNFLIIAFCMAAFCGLHLFQRRRDKLLWMAFSGLNAYAVTLAVNTLRIIMSIYIYRINIYGGWITPDRLHRLAGIVIYFFFLCLIYMIIHKGLQRFRGNCNARPARAVHFLRASVTMTPLLWYALITLGVPLVNAAYIGNGARFVEHIGMIACGCLIVMTTIFLIQWGWQQVKKYVRRF
jgi:exosortase K